MKVKQKNSETHLSAVAPCAKEAVTSKICATGNCAKLVKLFPEHICQQKCTFFDSYKILWFLELLTFIFSPQIIGAILL